MPYMTKTPTLSKRQKFYRKNERIKDRHNVHVEVSYPDFLALKSMLVLERISFSEWLGVQIKNAVK